MGFIGEAIGKGLGAFGGSLLGHTDAGKDIGGALGSFLPFKKGGRVNAMVVMNAKPKKRKAKKAGKKAKAKKGKKM